MAKIILFDLYDTVLKDISFDFDKGIEYLYYAYFRTSCSLVEFKNMQNVFYHSYEKRKEQHIEICLINDEIPCFFEKFKVTKPELDDMTDLEYCVMNQMQKVTLLDDVKRVIAEFRKNNIKMYILSNSIFTGNAARRLLNDFGIAEYFCKLYSSADYGIRKPRKDFYQLAIDDILLDNPNIRKKDILYVGNDYKTDVVGATGIGLRTVWYNVNHLPNKNNLLIDDFGKLLEISKH